MSAEAWVQALRAAIADYARSRRTTPVVRVTLLTGESRYVMRVSHGNELVVLDIYPDDDSELITIERRDDDGELEVDRVTPQQLVVPYTTILKVELLDVREIIEEQRRPPVGFVLDDDVE